MEIVLRAAAEEFAALLAGRAVRSALFAPAGGTVRP